MKNNFYADQPLFGGSKLPPPLTSSEEGEMLLRIHEAKVRQSLVEHNLRLVLFIAKKFSSATTELEDLVSIGTIGLIKAVNTFSPETGVKLATYVSRCIENEILMYLRKNQKHKYVASLDEPFYTDSEGNEVLLQDTIPDNKADIALTAYENSELISSAFNYALNNLSSKENQIFLYTVVEKKTQEEIGNILGISQSYVSRMQKKICKKLCKHFHV